MLNSVNHGYMKHFHHQTYSYYIQKCFIVDTLPRHLLPKSPKIKAQEISAKSILDPMYRGNADPNPYVHFNKLRRVEQYELPFAIRLSNILKISKDKLAKVLEDYPQITDITNTEKNIQEISDFLSETFGGESYMRTMIMRQPLTLDCDILYLQHQITEIVQHLCDHVIDDANGEINKAERMEFVLDIIRRQPTVLIQNIDGDVIPRILFLKQLLNPYQLTQLLLNLSSIIVMSFHRLIRIVFIQQMSKKQQQKNLIEISRNMELTKVNLNDVNIDKNNLELIKNQINNDGILLHEILRLRPTIMVKVFRDYKDWLYKQIETNYYYHPLLAEGDILKINDSSFYGEPILNFIDKDNDALIEGKVMAVNEKQSKYKQLQQIKAMRKHKTIRQLEILVGDVYKSNTFKQSIF